MGDPSFWGCYPGCEKLQSEFRAGYDRVCLSDTYEPDADGVYRGDWTKEFPLRPNTQEDRDATNELCWLITYMLVDLIKAIPSPDATRSVTEWFRYRASLRRRADDLVIQVAESEFLKLSLPWDYPSLRVLRNTHRCAGHANMLAEIDVALSSSQLNE